MVLGGPGRGGLGRGALGKGLSCPLIVLRIYSEDEQQTFSFQMQHLDEQQKTPSLMQHQYLPDDPGQKRHHTDNHAMNPALAMPSKP